MRITSAPPLLPLRHLNLNVRKFLKWFLARLGISSRKGLVVLTELPDQGASVLVPHYKGTFSVYSPT